MKVMKKSEKVLRKKKIRGQFGVPIGEISIHLISRENLTYLHFHRYRIVSC